jgi:hypothetical protein
MKPSFRSLALLLCFLFIFSASVFAESRSLDGLWQFTTDPAGKLTISDLPSVRDWREIRVPYSWNSQFADLRDYHGVAWYRTKFQLQPIKADQTVLIKFGAVDYFAEVFVNGQKAGEHEGGFLPFRLDVGKLVRAGENEIAVRVTDPDSDKARWGEMNFSELPHGKQSWYVQTGGIWQSVTIEVKTAVYTSSVKIRTWTDGRFEAQINTSSMPPHTPPVSKDNPSTRPESWNVPSPRVSIRGPEGKSLSFTPVHAYNYWLLSGKLTAPRLWKPDQPSLYTIEIRLGSDLYTDRFGFRSFEARDGKLYLNGEPIYLISALDQDFYPEGIYTPPSYEFLVDQMKKAKQMGLNMLRTHIKVPTPDYLRAADEVGMLIWYEIPSWDDNVWTPAAARRGEEIFLGQLERDWNHPSVVIQSIINEAWGVRNLKEAETRRWLKEAYNKLKPEASGAGRLVVDNSACCENFHLKSDIADFHQYYSIPDNYQKWDKWVADFAARPPWLWSEYGDAEPTGKEPLVLSEFGNWGLPELPQQLPWWFERGFGNREVTQPKGVFERFHAYKFDRLFAGFNDLARATQRHQWISLKHEIEEIRKHASIQGYTITEFTDLNWECNGLLDMWRNKKIYADDLAKIQQQDVIFARTPSHSYVSAEKIELYTHVSHYSAAATQPLTLNCYVSDKLFQKAKIKAVTRGSVVVDESFALTAPDVTKPTRMRVRLDLRDPGDKVIAENHLDLFIWPQPQKQNGRIYLTSGLTKLLEQLRVAGYTIASAPEAQTIVITDKLEAATQELLRSGRRVIVLANAQDALPADASIKIVPRKGVLDGNWVTNFNWVNVNRAPFKAVAFDQLPGFEAVAVIPEFVIQGVRPEEYDDVMAGIFYGWINSNHALMTGARSSEGKVLITTFRLADNYASDEYAGRLLDELIRFVASDEFAPKLMFR